MAKRLRGESTTPAKQQTNACILCNESTTDDSLECVWCERLQHRTCTKISDDQYCVLAPLEQKKDKVLRQKLAEMNKDDKVYKIKNGVIV